MRPETTKFLEKNIGSNVFDIRLAIIFVDRSPQAKKIKIKLLGIYQNKKLLHGKGNHKQNDKTTY